MKIGTRSLLFGVHQFLWHPFTVALAWRRCYRCWPNFEEAVAIFFHDWGYWGSSNMDGHEGLLHPITGAAIASKIAGPDAGRLVLWHSASFCRLVGRRRTSLLFLPDKVSVLYEPRWFYLLRALASGEAWEYIRVNAPPEFSTGRNRPWRWLNWYRAKVQRRLDLFHKTGDIVEL